MEDILSRTAFEFETVCRENSGYAYLGNNKALCRVLGKYKIYVDTRDIGITPHLVTDGFWGNLAHAMHIEDHKTRRYMR